LTDNPCFGQRPMAEQKFLAELGTTIAGCSGVVRRLFCEVQAFAVFDNGIVRSDLHVLSGEGKREAASYVVDTFGRQLWALVHLGTENLRGFGVMLSDTSVGRPAYSVARAVLEHCAIIGWMLDPKPTYNDRPQTVKQRMARGIYLRGSDLFEDWDLSRLVNPLKVNSEITPFEKTELFLSLGKHAGAVGIEIDTTTGGTPPVVGDTKVCKPPQTKLVEAIIQTVNHLTGDGFDPKIPYKVLSASAHARALPILYDLSLVSAEPGVPPVGVREITAISWLASIVWVETMARVAGYLGVVCDPDDPNNDLLKYLKTVHSRYLVAFDVERS
jgi:hypothetical protein